MKPILLCLILLSQTLFSSPFLDLEIEELWASLDDLYYPTLNDYKKIDAYLKTKRDYLASYEQCKGQRILNFQLLGPDDILPVLEKHSINVTEKTKHRCVLIYASQNGVYPEKARDLLQDLKLNGYSGHVLLQIGGFPDTPFGGLKLCHIPYAFKVAYFDYARRLGYKEVVWMDTSLHLPSNLELIFSEIQKRGYFLTSPGSLDDNPPSHWPETALSMGVSVEMSPDIPHIWSGLIGFNMDNYQAIQLLEGWLKETEKGTSSIAGFPELSLSILAWRIGMKPVLRTGAILCNACEKELLP